MGMKTLAVNASLKSVAREVIRRATISLRKWQNLENIRGTTEDFHKKVQMRQPTLDAFIQLTADAEMAHHLCRHAKIQLREDLIDFVPSTPWKDRR